MSTYSSWKLFSSLPAHRQRAWRRSCCAFRTAEPSTPPTTGTPQLEVPNRLGQVLVVGATGRTGRAALQGMLDSGLPAQRIQVLALDPNTPAAQQLQQQGHSIVEGDLDNPDSLHAVLRGVGAVYIHALANDAAAADPLEVTRARALRIAMYRAGVRHVVYNSSAGRGCRVRVSQMEQKHAIEDMLAGALPLTSLQATLFMEEFWRPSTREAILKGTLELAVPSDRPIQLVSVKDLGKLAVRALARPRLFAGQFIPLAGDELTPQQLAEAFSAAQGRQVSFQELPPWPLLLFCRDAYNYTRFLREKGYEADIDWCRHQFGLMNFRTFLEDTNWGNPPAS